MLGEKLTPVSDQISKHEGNLGQKRYQKPQTNVENLHSRQLRGQKERRTDTLSQPSEILRKSPSTLAYQSNCSIFMSGVNIPWMQERAISLAAYDAHGLLVIFGEVYPYAKHPGEDYQIKHGALAWLCFGLLGPFKGLMNNERHRCVGVLHLLDEIYSDQSVEPVERGTA